MVIVILKLCLAKMKKMNITVKKVFYSYLNLLENRTVLNPLSYHVTTHFKTLLHVLLVDYYNMFDDDDIFPKKDRKVQNH